VKVTGAGPLEKMKRKKKMERALKESLLLGGLFGEEKTKKHPNGSLKVLGKKPRRMAPKRG